MSNGNPAVDVVRVLVDRLLRLDGRAALELVSDNVTLQFSGPYVTPYTISGKQNIAALGGMLQELRGAFSQGSAPAALPSVTHLFGAGDLVAVRMETDMPSRMDGPDSALTEEILARRPDPNPYGIEYDSQPLFEVQAILRVADGKIEHAWIQTSNALARKQLLQIGRWLGPGNEDPASRAAWTKNVQKTGETPHLATYITQDEQMRDVPTDKRLFQAAIRNAYQELKRARETNYGLGIRNNLSYLGEALTLIGRPEKAVELLREKVDIERGLGHTRMMMIAQVYLGRAEMYRGNLSVAEQLLLEARDLSEGDGMRDLRSMPCHYLGLTYLEQGRQQEAIQTLQEALDSTRELRPFEKLIQREERALAYAQSWPG